MNNDVLDITPGAIAAAIGEYCRRHNCSWQPRAALIDMDGTLIDSMRSHAAAWKRMTDREGLSVPQDEFYLYEGMTGRATIQMLWKRDKGYVPTDEEADELYAVKGGYFNEMPKVPVMPGAAQMLRTLMAEGITRVLVTGSKQLSSLNRLDDDFPGAFPHNLRVTATDVAHGKPSPEPYLKAMEMASVKPEQSIVIENAPLGVESGARSGAFVIAVTTGPIPASAMTTAGAHLVFPTMPSLAAAIQCIIKN